MTMPTSDCRIEFQANFSCFIFNRAVVVTEPLYVVLNKNGEYELYFFGEEEPWAWLRRGDVNKLAGADIV
jgi:hypothetical protein